MQSGIVSRAGIIALPWKKRNGKTKPLSFLSFLPLPVQFYPFLHACLVCQPKFFLLLPAPTHTEKEIVLFLSLYATELARSLARQAVCIAGLLFLHCAFLLCGFITQTVPQCVRACGASFLSGRAHEICIVARVCMYLSAWLCPPWMKQNDRLLFSLFFPGEIPL